MPADLRQKVMKDHGRLYRSLPVAEKRKFEENMCLEVARKVITELESAKRRELEERLMLERTRQYLTQEVCSILLEV